MAAQGRTGADPAEEIEIARTKPGVPKSPVRIHFTKVNIDKLPLPSSGRAKYYDAARSNLGLRVYPSGRMVWFWIGRHNGQSVRETLGIYRRAPGAEVIITPAKAKTLARDFQPGELRKAATTNITLGKAYADYCEHHKVRSPKTRDSEWKNYLKKWKDKKLDAITKAEVRKWFRDLTTTTSPSTANRALTRLRAMYSWARQQMDYEGADPTHAVQKHSEKGARRKRRLRMDELPAFFEALDKLTPDMADFFRVVLFTGQRAGNVKAMRWADLDLSGNLWAIPETKQGGAADVALAPQVVEILTRRQQSEDERIRAAKLGWQLGPTGEEPRRSPYVFPARSRSGHLQTYQKAWLELCAAAKIEGLRVHDLRRSLASFAQDAGVGTALVAAQLGHSDAATTLRHYTSISNKAQQEAIGAVIAALLRGDGE